MKVTTLKYHYYLLNQKLLQNYIIIKICTYLDKT
jgi:hypothetical protein